MAARKRAKSGVNSQAVNQGQTAYQPAYGFVLDFAHDPAYLSEITLVHLVHTINREQWH